MAKPLLLIDGDILVYSSISAVERAVETEEDLWVMWSDEREARSHFIDQYERICEKLPFHEPYLCLTEGHNFRYDVDPTYKGNRKKVRKPMGFLEHKEWVKDTHKTIIKPGIEADDTLGILMTKPGSTDNVLWSGDKDLKQIPGKHLGPDGETIVTPIEADLWFMTQVLTGDPTDGYPGCPGIGKVKAEKLLSEAEAVELTGAGKFMTAAWPIVVLAYEKAGLTEEVALRQARLARILRWDDWDSSKQEVKLWEPK